MNQYEPTTTLGKSISYQELNRTGPKLFKTEKGKQKKKIRVFTKKRVVNGYITFQIKPLICDYAPLRLVEAWARRGRRRGRNARRPTRPSSLRSRPASSDRRRCCSAASCASTLCRATCCGARSCSCGGRGGAPRRCRRR